MELDVSYTKLYWAFIAGLILTQPECTNKTKCLKCKYNKLCDLAIKIVEEL